MERIRFRKRYSKEFKVKAVNLVIQREGKVSEVARELDIHTGMLHRWIREYTEDPAYAFPGLGTLKEPDEELRQLRKEVKDLREERDILKKALSIFSGKER